ncbi:MAG TPA: class I SAM-dependent methyltransferase [Opitutaceae bacterium]
MNAAKVAYLHSSEWRSAPVDQQIEAYLGALELHAAASVETTYRRLKAKYARELKALEKIVGAREEGDCSDDFYGAKNSSLDFSLLVGSAFRGPVHLQLMRWIATHQTPPRRLLDIGCENCLLTGFYALLWPATEIVAIDPAAKAVSRGKELVAGLRLANVTVIHADLDGYRQQFPEARHDLVLTTLVLHEAKVFKPLQSSRHFAENAFAADTPPIPPAFHQVSQILDGPDAAWIGAEEITIPHLFWRWALALRAASLHVQLERSVRLKADTGHITVLRAGVRIISPFTPDQGFKFWTDHVRPSIADATPPIELSELGAYAVFTSIIPRTRVASAKLWMPGSPPGELEFERVELWVNESLAVFLRTDANCQVHLRVEPRERLSELREEWEQIVKKYENSGSHFESNIDA